MANQLGPILLYNDPNLQDYKHQQFPGLCFFQSSQQPQFVQIHFGFLKLVLSMDTDFSQGDLSPLKGRTSPLTHLSMYYHLYNIISL